MIAHCIQNLNDIKTFLSKINDDCYPSSCKTLSGASIGQHVRHILEFYLCLLNGANQGNVNYDDRKRDFQLESDRKFAIFSIDKICCNLPLLPSNMTMTLTGDFCMDGSNAISIVSSVERELAYCLEHAIHHMALIKVGTIDLEMDHVLDKNFGIAPSTIRNTNLVCAQ